MTSGREARRRVDDHVVERRAQHRIELAQELDGDARGLVRPDRRDQGPQPGRMLDEVRVDLVRVERAARGREVEEVRTGSSPSARPRSPNWRSRSTTTVRLPSSARAQPRFAARERLAGPALGPEHRDQRAAVTVRARAAARRGARSPSAGRRTCRPPAPGSPPASRCRRRRARTPAGRSRSRRRRRRPRPAGPAGRGRPRAGTASAASECPLHAISSASASTLPRSARSPMLSSTPTTSIPGSASAVSSVFWSASPSDGDEVLDRGGVHGFGSSARDRHGAAVSRFPCTWPSPLSACRRAATLDAVTGEVLLSSAPTGGRSTNQSFALSDAKANWAA